MSDIKKLNDIVQNLEDEKFKILNENKKLKEENKINNIKLKRSDEIINDLKEKLHNIDKINETKKRNDSNIDKYIWYFKICENLIYLLIDNISNLKLNFENSYNSLTLQNEYNFNDKLKNLDYINILKDTNNLFSSSLIKKHNVFFKLKNKILKMSSIDINSMDKKYNILWKNIKKGLENNNNLDIELIKESFNNHQKVKLSENEDINKLVENLINSRLNENLLNKLENSTEPNNSLYIISNLFEIITLKFKEFNPNLFTLKNLKSILLDIEKLTKEFKNIINENLIQSKTMDTTNYSKKRNFTFNNLNFEDMEIKDSINNIEKIILVTIKTITKDLNDDEIYKKLLRMNLKLTDFHKVKNNKEIIDKQNELITNKISYLNFEIIKTKKTVEIYKNNIDEKKKLIKKKKEELKNLQDTENKYNNKLEESWYEMLDLSDKIYIKENISNIKTEKLKINNNYQEKRFYYENLKIEKENLQSEIINIQGKLKELDNNYGKDELEIKNLQIKLKTENDEFFENYKKI